jgi:hypothetical protein
MHLLDYLAFLFSIGVVVQGQHILPIEIVNVVEVVGEEIF